MKRVLKKINNPIYLFLLLTVAFAGCTIKGEEPCAESVKYVKVETIAYGQSQEQMVFNGNIKEKSLTVLSFRVGGPLARLPIKTGDYVCKGQVIAEIDKRDYQIQLQTTKAQFEQVEGEYNRYKKLVEMKKIPQNSFEKIESGYKMAKAGYENAQNQLNDTELRAPFSGYVHQKMTENFQTVGPGQPIVSIIDMSQLEAVVNVPENQLQWVKLDNESFLNVENAKVEMHRVSLLSVGEKAKQDGLYEVKFSFANDKRLNISPGMTAEVILICDAQNNLTTIPWSAVFHEKTSDFVWVLNIKNNKVQKRKVELDGVQAAGRIHVLSGLKNNEKIITAGVHYLFEGQKVKALPAPSVTNVGGLL